jgi:hypothetical protein
MLKSDGCIRQCQQLAYVEIVFLPVRCVRMNFWVSLNLTFVSGTIGIFGMS